MGYLATRLLMSKQRQRRQSGCLCQTEVLLSATVSLVCSRMNGERRRRPGGTERHKDEHGVLMAPSHRNTGHAIYFIVYCTEGSQCAGIEGRKRETLLLPENMQGTRKSSHILQPVRVFLYENVPEHIERMEAEAGFY